MTHLLLVGLWYFLKQHAECIWFAAQPREEITITLPDGSERKGKSWETSPLDIAKMLSKSLADRVVIAKARVCYMNIVS
jgi:hypothetical protein